MEISFEGRNFPRYYMALNQRGGVQDYYSYGDRLNFSNKTDYEDWFERIKGFNENVKNSLKNNKEGLEMGYTQPKLVTRAVVSQIESLLASSMEDHPYYKIFLSANEIIGDEEASEIQSRVKDFIKNELNPSYRKLMTFLKNQAALDISAQFASAFASSLLLRQGCRGLATVRELVLMVRLSACKASPRKAFL